MALADALSEANEFDRAESMYRDSADRFVEKPVGGREHPPQPERPRTQSRRLRHSGTLGCRKPGVDPGHQTTAPESRPISATSPLQRSSKETRTSRPSTYGKGSTGHRGSASRSGPRSCWSALPRPRAQGDPRRAAMLLGASARIQDEIGATLGSFEGGVQVRTRDAVADTLGDMFR